jgi:hypothetical protein
MFVVDVLKVFVEYFQIENKFLSKKPIGPIFQATQWCSNSRMANNMSCATTCDVLSVYFLLKKIWVNDK